MSMRHALCRLPIVPTWQEVHANPYVTRWTYHLLLLSWKATSSRSLPSILVSTLMVPLKLTPVAVLLAGR